MFESDAANMFCVGVGTGAQCEKRADLYTEDKSMGMESQNMRTCGGSLATGNIRLDAIDDRVPTFTPHPFERRRCSQVIASLVRSQGHRRAPLAALP